MAYQVFLKATFVWQPDGAGPGMSSGAGAQSIALDNFYGANGGAVQVPGGDSPVAANITTALATAAANLANGVNNGPLLAQIQGWSSGRG